MKAYTRNLLTLFIALAATMPLTGQSPAEIQERMRERLPAIDSLKLEGAVGENNSGYLEARISLNNDQSRMVAEENADRQRLYNIAARRANVSLSEVEKMRTKQIRERSPRGIWLQNDEGEWYQKQG